MPPVGKPLQEMYPDEKTASGRESRFDREHLEQQTLPNPQAIRAARALLRAEDALVEAAARRNQAETAFHEAIITTQSDALQATAADPEVVAARDLTTGGSTFVS